MKDSKSLLQQLVGPLVTLVSPTVAWTLAERIPTDAGYRLTLLFSVFLSVALLGIAVSFGIVRGIRPFCRRLFEKDLAFRPWLSRLGRWLTGGAFRLAHELCFSNTMRMVFMATACGAILILITKYTGVRRHGWVDFRWVYANYSIAVFLFFVTVEGARERILSRRLQDDIKEEVFGQVKRWRAVDVRHDGRVRADFSAALKDAGMPIGVGVEAADIALNDEGPIRVYSINYYEWLLKRNGWRLLEEILSKNHILWLLAEPTSKAIRRRDFWLNGRFLERYAHHYMAVLLECFNEMYLRGDEARMKLRYYTGPPTYRMVLSDTRAIVQKYPRRTHGRSEDAIVVHRVISAFKLNSLLRPLVVNALEEFKRNRAREDFSPSHVFRFQERIEDTLAQSEVIGRDGRAPGLYMHFRRAFDSVWNDSVSGEPESFEEKFVDEWGAQPLERWAKACGYSRRTINSCGGDPQNLADLICERLGLSDLLKAVRALRPPPEGVAP
jgi:hypothetical protein